jgi:hypothetical protein
MNLDRSDQQAPYEAPSVEEVSDGDCPIATASMFSAVE